MTNNPHPRGSVKEAVGISESASPSGVPTLVQQSPNAMNGEILQCKVTITNPHGFHMRPATAFAQLANQFQSKVTLWKEEQGINGKSPLELMLLAAEQGTELILEVAGPDARNALEALARLLGAPSMSDQHSDWPLPPKG